MFGVSLDELVGQAPPAGTDPAAPDPQVVIVERQHLPARLFVGGALLFLGILLLFWAAIQGDLLAGVLLTVPVFLCAGLCLKLQRPGLWCGWTILDYFLLAAPFATGVNLFMAFRPAFYWEWAPAQLLIAYGLLAALIAMILWTARRYRDLPLRKHWIPIVCWGGVVACTVLNRLLVQLLTINSADSFVWSFFQLLAFFRIQCFAAACVFTIRYFRNRPSAQS